MNTKTKRRYSAWVLLSVFLPMLVLSSLHIHERVAAEGDCVDCVNHLPHAGHLSLNTDASHDCVLCQFTTLPFLVAVVITVGTTVNSKTFIVLLRPSHLSNRVGRLQSPRAPPVV